MKEAIDRDLDADSLFGKQIDKEYEYGFTTDVEAYTLPPGLNEM